MRARTPLLLALAALLASGGCKKGRRAIQGGAAAVAETRAAAEQSTQAEVLDPSEALAAASRATGTPVGPPKVIAFTATDTGITGPDSVPNGAVEIRLTNRGQAPHELRLLRLAPQMTAEQAMAALSQGPDLPRSLSPRGGAGPVMPGKSTTVVELLGPGTYLALCHLNAGDGKAWYTKGVVRTLTVTGVAPARPQPPVIPAGSAIVTSDKTWKFGVSLRTSSQRTLLIEGRNRRTDIPGGDNIIMLEHYGREGHDAVIMRATEPRQMREYVAWLEGRRPDPPDIVGGIPGLVPQMRAWFHLQLEPGAYIIFCPNFHQRTGARGFELGEYDQFVVK
jgi:hypothetical protein